MPDNIVKIDNFKNLEWYIGNNKVKELIVWLNENGTQIYIAKESKKDIFVKVLKNIFKRRW